MHAFDSCIQGTKQNFKCENKATLSQKNPRFLMALGAAFADVVLREQGLRVSTGERDPLWYILPRAQRGKGGLRDGLDCVTEASSRRFEHIPCVHFTHGRFGSSRLCPSITASNSCSQHAASPPLGLSSPRQLPFAWGLRHQRRSALSSRLCLESTATALGWLRRWRSGLPAKPCGE